ncbi:hypothetical protein DXG01_002560 [Tephrocybe rancida]|nr:hypothetical protein DXG01_002560 [Tephrocybe rancida]
MAEENHTHILLPQAPKSDEAIATVTEATSEKDEEEETIVYDAPHPGRVSPTPATSYELKSSDNATTAAPGPAAVATEPSAATEPTATTEAEPSATLTAPPAEPGASPSVATPTPTVAVAPEPTPASVPVEAIPVTAPTATPVVSGSVAPVTATEKKTEEATEPENALTKRFTEKEWKSLKKFKADLPEIFAEGFPDDPKASEKPISFWGVNIDPQAPLDARVSVVLMKNLSVPDAREMFVSTLRWRTSIGIDALLKEEFPQDVFGDVGHIFGRDHQGRPVVYNIYGGNNLADVFSDTQRFIRLSRCEPDQPGRKVQGSRQRSYQHLPKPLPGATGTPLRLSLSNVKLIFLNTQHKKFFVNVPTLMNWIFWAFKPLLPAATLAKMSVVGSGHHALKKALLPVIDAKELPQRYGGEAEGW